MTDNSVGRGGVAPSWNPRYVAWCRATGQEVGVRPGHEFIIWSSQMADRYRREAGFTVGRLDARYDAWLEARAAAAPTPPDSPSVDPRGAA